MTSERGIPHLRDIFGLGAQHFHHHPHHHNHHHQHHYSELFKDKNEEESENKKSGSNNGSASKKSKRDNHKTLTSGDVKTLERHLSMKKTIRKKIMRDLSQAFVEDPSEFRVTEHSTPEQLRAELSAEAMKFGDSAAKDANKRQDSNFLDMLRGDSRTRNGGSGGPEYSALSTRNDDDDGGHGNGNHGHGGQQEKTSFWRRLTMKNKNKR